MQVAWQRYRLDDNVEVEVLLDGQDSDSSNLIHYHDSGEIQLQLTSFSGQLRLRLASSEEPNEIQQLTNLSSLSIGKSGDDPGILGLPSLLRQTTDGSKNIKSDDNENSEEALASKRRVSLDQTASMASEMNNALRHPADAAISSVKPWLSDTTSSAGSAVPRSSAASHVSAFSAGSPARKRPTLSAYLSPRTLNQLAVVDDSGQNELHRLCAASSINFRKIQAIMATQPELVKQADDNGLLPLHVLGKNSELVNHAEGQASAKRVAYLLMEGHPDGLVHEDNDGQMPFTHLIQAWVEWTFEHFLGFSRHDKSKEKSSIASHLQNLHESLTKTIKRSESRDSDSPTDRGITSSYIKFPPVMIFDEIRWCFEMLSIAIEHLGGTPLETAQKVRPRLAYSKQRDDRGKLAQNVAKIPDLLQSILLLESKEMSKEVLESPFVRRMLLCPEAYGPWLTQMMRQKTEPSSEIAVNLLSIVSELDVKDFVGSVRKSSPRDEQLFQEAKLSVFEYLESFDGMIPSLLILEDDLGDQALATPVIRFIMSRTISDPFSVLMGSAELKLNIAFIAAFREFVLFSDTPSIILPLVTPETVIVLIFFSQVFRRFLETRVLLTISSKVAKHYIFNGWTILDLGAVVLATAISFVLLRHEEINRPFVNAIVLGLVWLKILGFLKIVNEQLATFIIAVTRIFFDLRYFFTILFVFIWMMGDIFVVVFKNDDNIDCEADDLGVPENSFCRTESAAPYLRVYSVIVGDFEYEDYSDTGSVKALWLGLTLFGTVILLNVLIAIVTFSYSSCQASSVLLFRRARAQYCATHTALYDFSFSSPQDCKWTLFWILRSSTRMIVALSFVAALAWSTLFVFSRLASSIEAKSSVGIVVFGIISAFSVYTAIVGNFVVCLKILHYSGPRRSHRALTEGLLSTFHLYFVRFTGLDKDGKIGRAGKASTTGKQRHDTLVSRLDALEMSLEETLMVVHGASNLSDDEAINEAEQPRDSFLGQSARAKLASND